MPYYHIKISLNDNQMHQIIQAIQNFQRVTITFSSNQIASANGDIIMVTAKQYERLMLAKHAHNSISITFSKKQLHEMSGQIGNGILDSIGNFFKSGYSKVKNFITGPKKPANIEMKNMANINPPKVKDYGQQFDNMQPGYKPPKQSGFDKFANKVGHFDKKLTNIFDYGGPGTAPKDWKQQKLAYAPNGFFDEGYF